MKKLAWAIGIMALAGTCLVMGTIGGMLWQKSDYIPGEPAKIEQVMVLSDDEIDFDTPIDQLTDEQIIMLDERAMTATAQAEPAPTKPPTQSSAFSPSEEASITSYMNAMMPLLEEYIIYAEDMSLMFLAMGNDVNLLFDVDWQTEMAFGLAMLDVTLTDMKAIEKPASNHPTVNDMYNGMYCAADEMSDAIPDIIYGLDNFDVDGLEKGLAHIEESNDCMDDANFAIEQIVALME